MCPDGGALFGSALKHTTLSTASFAELPNTVEALQCVVIEVRNDLDGSLFDGRSARAAGQAVLDANLKILSLADKSGCSQAIASLS